MVSDNAAYYGNRSAAYLALGKHKDAINDAKIATSIDENYVKVWFNRSNPWFFRMKI